MVEFFLNWKGGEISVFIHQIPIKLESIYLSWKKRQIHQINSEQKYSNVMLQDLFFQRILKKLFETHIGQILKQYLSEYNIGGRRISLKKGVRHKKSGLYA